jgi:hypothetical protein
MISVPGLAFVQDNAGALKTFKAAGRNRLVADPAKKWACAQLN